MRSRRRRRHRNARRRHRHYEQGQRIARRIRQIPYAAGRDIRSLPIRLRDDVDRRLSKPSEPVQHESDGSALRNSRMGYGRRQTRSGWQLVVVFQSFLRLLQTEFPQRFGLFCNAHRRSLLLCTDRIILSDIIAALSVNNKR